MAQRQAEIAQRGLVNERYQKGAEMLGSNVLSVRLGGIYALQGLAKEDPEQYHVQIMRLLCAFVCNPPKDERMVTHPEVWRTDVKAIINAIAARSDADIAREKEEEFNLDLGGAHLPYGTFTESNLSGASFSHANLSNATLLDAKLSNATLTGAKLFDTNFRDANISGARFSVSGRFPAEGLTQSQLDEARADPKRPPKLQGVLDIKTNKPLVWRGKPLRDNE